MSAFGIPHPVWAAPMAGGASTVDLVAAAGRAGSLGFLAGGYRDAAQLREQIAAVRAAGVPFGVNLFAPNPVPITPAAFQRYALALSEEAAPYGIDAAGVPLREDDDGWEAKLALLRETAPPFVTFTFGLPGTDAFAGLRAAGSIVGQTVTSVAEARDAVAAGAMFLVVQAASAGGHSGTLTPDAPAPSVPLPDLVRAVGDAVAVPLVAAGGVGTGADVRAAREAGAAAVSVGTALLLADEAGTSPVHRAALASGAFTETVVTRAFTGRPARALRNGWTDRHAEAPLGYPALHHLTSGIRRAAAAAGDADRVHLWAGEGFAHARTGTVAEILDALRP